MRKSSYCIIHGSGILLHGLTGALDRADTEILSLLDRPQELLEVLTSEEVYHLIKRGYLTEKSPSEEHSIFEQIASAMLHSYEKAVRFVLVPTYGCNLRCNYCFEQEYRGDARVMDENTIDAAFRAMASIQENCQVHPVSLFGGEPFMTSNHAVVTSIVKRGIQNGYTFAAVSNGVEVDHFETILTPENFCRIQITLDGPEKIHNERRGAFRAIVDNIDMLLDQELKVSVRTNVDMNNVYYVKELARFYMEKGWQDQPTFSAYCDAVFGCFFTGVKVSKVEIWRILLEEMEEYPELECMDLGRINQNRVARLVKSDIPQFSPTYCPANGRNFVFDAYGSIYACEENMGNTKSPSFIGRYYPEFFLTDVIEKWKNRNILTMEECQKCSLALLCGGGCADFALTEKGELKKHFCEDFKEQLEVCLPLILKKLDKKGLLRERK